MANYKIWHKKGNEEELLKELLIEVFNDCDILSVQKDFIEDGYKIIQCQKWYNHTLMLVVKVA